MCSLAWQLRSWLTGLTSMTNQEWLGRELAVETPDVVIVHGPALLAGALLAQLQQYLHRLRIILYFTIEGQAASDALLGHVAMTDLCIVHTNAARTDLERLLQHTNDPLAHHPPTIVCTWAWAEYEGVQAPAI